MAEPGSPKAKPKLRPFFLSLPSISAFAHPLLFTQMLCKEESNIAAADAEGKAREHRANCDHHQQKPPLMLDRDRGPATHKHAPIVEQHTSLDFLSARLRACPKPTFLLYPSHPSPVPPAASPQAPRCCCCWGRAGSHKKFKFTCLYYINRTPICSLHHPTHPYRHSLIKRETTIHTPPKA